MFKLQEESQYYWFDGNSPEPPLTFELVGTLMGMAFYNNGSPCGAEQKEIETSIEVPLAPVIYKILMGGKPDLEDFSMWDPTLYDNFLSKIKGYGPDMLEHCGAFSVTETVYGVTKEVDLITNGQNISINVSNREEFVKKRVEYEFET
jgi:hypothetical protein